MLRKGYHVSIAGGIFNGFEYAEMIGCTSMQIFLSSPRSWSVREIGIEERNKFIEKSKKTNITPVVVHMPYLPNLASPNDEVYKKSVNVLCSIINECEALGIEYVVAHLGSELGKGKENGIKRVVDAIKKAKEVNNGVYLLLENQAGQKNSVGSKHKITLFYKMSCYFVFSKILLTIPSSLTSCSISECGVSNIKLLLCNLLSDKNSLKPSIPMLPKPMHSCLSLPEPNSCLASFK